MGPDNALVYPMQLGSGTVDPFVGLTALGQADRYSYGGQLRYRVHLYDNAADYRFGNQFNYHLWMAYRATDWVSVSGRLSYQRIGDIDGADLSSFG
ncbi:transporter [Neolewinella sp.]|uniref:transporter n=1 Tax=Neolewinella sp. TaxID=2993543 RepID=UPI003B530114